MDEVTPVPLKTKSTGVKLENEVVQQLSLIMGQNNNKLSICDKYLDIKKTDKTVIQTVHTLKVIQENKVNILTPLNLNAILPLDKPVGFEMKFFNISEKRHGPRYRLAQVDGPNSYFDYMFSDGRIDNRKYLWNEGIQYILVGNGDDAKYRKRGEIDSCRFKLGSCSVISSRGRNQEILVEFQDGVWYYSYSRFGNNITDIIIYDWYGLPLYSKHHIHGRTSHIEYVRTFPG